MSNDGANFSLCGSRPLFGSDLLSGIVASAADIAVIVDASGTISAAMASADSRAFGEVAKWQGKSLRTLVDEDSFAKFQTRQAEVAAIAASEDNGVFRWAELIHLDKDGNDYPVRYSIHWLGDRDQVLMLGRDQRQIIEIQQQLIAAQVALERDFEAQRMLDTRYRLLMDSTSDAFVLISMQSGKVVDLNHNAASIIGHARNESIGTDFAAEFEGIRSTGLLSAIAASFVGDLPRMIELQLKRSQRAVAIYPKVFRAAGERLALCRLEDKSKSVPTSSRLSGWLSELFYQGTDAIVFTDKDGTIEMASDAFLNLIDADGLNAIRGRSLADFLSRGAVDLRVLLENARRAGHVRTYATRLTTDFNAHVSVEIAAAWLNDRADPTLALVIRDSSLTARLRGEISQNEENARGVMELVGSAPLKEIVAETTNEVEKICIETAIELTRNNRVAAAEMLGLSRQSLYVKLRKYGMLGRDEE